MSNSAFLNAVRRHTHHVFGRYRFVEAANPIDVDVIHVETTKRAGKIAPDAHSLNPILRRDRAAGIHLFTRTTRNAVPTEASRRLLDRVRPALAEVASAFDGLANNDEAAGTLKLDVPGIVACDILPPIAAAFHLTHPHMRLRSA